MSKKKNTLKDLDEFLKQQAATFVSPDQLSQKVEDPAPAQASTQHVPGDITMQKILTDLKTLAKNAGPEFQQDLCDLIIKSLEDHPYAKPEDKLLINTALYLKNGNNWKDAIRNYWKGKS